MAHKKAKGVLSLSLSGAKGAPPAVKRGSPPTTLLSSHPKTVASDFGLFVGKEIMSARNVYIVAAKRTPFGTFGGKLRDVSATQMAAHACRATLSACSPLGEFRSHCLISDWPMRSITHLHFKLLSGVSS